MFRFFRSRVARIGFSRPLPALGRLELALMDLLWSRSECTVREAMDHLERPLAYTTVMTTLDRLYKKGLLNRHKSQRAFVYSAGLSRAEWERRCAGDLVSGFLSGPNPSQELLLSCLLDAVGGYDPALLDALEKKIRARRREISRPSQP